MAILRRLFPSPRYQATVLTVTIQAEDGDRLEDIQRLVKMMPAVVAGVWEGQAVTLNNQTDPALMQAMTTTPEGQ